MGVKYGKEVLYALTGLWRRDVADICRMMAADIGMTTPTIDADCSNVCFKVGKTAESVANHLTLWANSGIQVTPICDGKERPISKQATNERKANREKNRIKAHLFRTDILSLNRQLKADWLTDTERNDIREEIAKKQTSMKSKETQSQNVIQTNFDERLVEELQTTGAHTRNEAGGSVAKVQIAEFQADAVMMGRVVNGKTLMVMTDDADIPIICGDKCIAIKGYTKDGAIQLVSTSRETIEKLHKYLVDAQKDLPDDEKSNSTFTPAAYPLFEGVDDRKLRAIMALYLGCDVYVKGMAGVGVKTLDEIINVKYKVFKEQGKKGSLFGFLKKYFYTYTEGFDDDVVHTYIRALVYEPTNLAPEDEAEEGDYRSWLDQPPTKLPLYCEEFQLKGQTEIFDGPKIAVCKGVGMCTHKFLEADGCDKCSSCNEIVCKHCRESIDGEVHCLPCFAAESLIPESNDVEGGMPISEMRDLLSKKYDVEKANELTVDEVVDLFAIKETATARINEMATDVPFPIFPSSGLDADDLIKWSNIVDVNFGEGGSFISDPELEAQYLPSILELFASLVRFDSDAKKTDWEKDPLLYKAIPSMFIDFANKSRIDGGYRLLKRCIRHAFDSRCKPIDSRVGTLVVDNENNVGIRLGSDIPASMRKNIYNTEVVATAKQLLCCKCNCQCGSQGDERIVCVHTMVVLYLLSMLMIEDMAEHLLIALAARINGSYDGTSSMSTNEHDLQWIWNMSNWTDEEIEGMKQDIITLMETAGEIVTTQDSQSKSIPELLQAFVVGTERRKEWKEKSKKPLKPSELGPIENINFVSTSRRARDTMQPTPANANEAVPPSNPCACSFPDCPVNNGNQQSVIGCKIPSCSNSAHRLCQHLFEEKEGLVHHENDVYCYDCHPKTLPAPEYLKILAMMNVSGCAMDETLIVGQRLLALRGINDMGDDFTQLTKKEKEASPEWKLLEKASKQRSRNMAQSQLKNLHVMQQPSATKPSDDADRPPPVTPSPKKNVRRPGHLLPNRSSRESPTLSTPSDIAQTTTPRPTRTATKAPTTKKPKVKKKRPVYQKCHCWGGKCKVNNKSHVEMKFHAVPVYPAALKSANPRRDVVIRRFGKILLRQETLRRMGYKADDKGGYRICENHQFEQVTKSIEVKFKEEVFTRSFRLTVPSASGPESSEMESTSSKGLGGDRAVCTIIDDLQKKIQVGQVPPSLSFEDLEEECASAKPATTKEELHQTQEELLVTQTKCDHLEAELASANLARSQDWEHNSDEKHISINPTVKRKANLTVHRELPSFMTENATFFHSKMVEPKSKKPRVDHTKTPPKVDINIPDEEVKRRTGFPTLAHLLSYIFIVCNGNVDTILEKRTVLTWFEAWFMHFELKWGRTLQRMTDVAVDYGPDKKELGREIALKYSIECRARKSWPTYVSYEEDKKLRNDEKWGRKYNGLRPVMWDMTNIPAYGFSDADFNRRTYSKYYAMNCFKGGVFLQLCGWLGTANLWTGAVSDTDYNKRAGYLQEQESFQSNDLVNNEVVPFTNIYDKGYRAKMVAWRAGKQRVLQPVWAESDKRFKRDDTLLTAGVAHDRGGNERAVNVCKRSMYVSKGFEPNANAKQLNDSWMTWSFQCNFMFKPVL